MARFLKDERLTRTQIWSRYHPDATSDKPRGGNWDTGYVSEGGELIAFLNIGDSGRTGHDFENGYDPESGIVTWFGKPGSHSMQPLFQKIIAGTLILHFFARWKNTDREFTYLGQGRIISFEDGVHIGNDRTAIRTLVSLSTYVETIGAEGVPVDEDQESPTFAKRSTVLVNRYERDPQKRRECLEHHGYHCQICGFDFEQTYGKLGRDFIHVHHIEPLAEVGGEYDIDPKVDLIPVCANCHAMIHRVSPALKPDQLKRILLR
jgi:5-methylcytosine-specific restriction protein A